MNPFHYFCLWVMIAVAAVLSLPNPAHADSYAATIAAFNRSKVVQPFFKSAYGYAVFPLIGKGGFAVGGAFGKGRVYCGGKVTGEVKLLKATVGLQLGGQAFSELIFLRDKRAYDKFTNGSFEFDAAASAVAITAGAQATAGTEGSTASATAGPATGRQARIQYYKGMAVFVHTRGGLMYEAAIGGQKFIFEPR
jgi:lipid-binding SYLF domain-containing protein